MDQPAYKKRLKRASSWIKRTLLVDRYTLRRQLRQLQRGSHRAAADAALDRRLSTLEQRIQASIDRRRQRQKNLPVPLFVEDLPILKKKDEIINAISNHRVVVIAGETGSGKTTQIPKFCLAAGRGVDGKIGCTQPRRIAATSVARRIAEEFGQQPGQIVGYKIRFKDRSRQDTYIKLMTDGILLAETQADPFLNAYDTLIVDEAHERSLNIDFILGILKRLVTRRRNLRVIITSATIDTEKFSRAFDNAPVIDVPGRMYPVEVRYQPLTTTTDDNDDQTYVDGAVATTLSLLKSTREGDILVFMPTEQDIRDTCDLLQARPRLPATVLPLFARLASAEQKRVFARGGGRKVIVATNVAETSLTIPGIRYVIDTGLARISTYIPRSRTTALPVVPVSRSSADQRKGRCGRVSEGICIRLYSEADFLDRPLYTPPEILRANLAEVILRMIALKLGDISEFPFVDRPADRSINDGIDLLLDLGAIMAESKRRSGSKAASGYRLTGHGRVMAQLPVDPRLSRMLLEARQRGCLKAVTIVAAVLSIQDPRERPADKQEAADRVHEHFRDPQSDFVTLLNVWRFYDDARRSGASRRQLKRKCRDSYLSYRRMREWRDIYNQLRQSLADHGYSFHPGPVDYIALADPQTSRHAALHRSILSGLLSNIAQKKEKNFFKAARGREVMVFPGSALFNHAGQWIMAAEMVETSRLFARMAANIDPAWVEAAAGDKCRRTYLDPHWERNRGQVVATEQVSLFGLIIASGRKVSYGRIDAVKAHQIFIQSALINGDVRTQLPFMRHNAKLIAEVQAIEDRVRRRDLLVDDQVLMDFYSPRLPEVVDLRTLRNHIKQRGGDGFLKLQRQDLIRYQPDADELDQFPDHIAVGKGAFRCDYAYEPGQKKDGVTIEIPSGQADYVPPEQLEWLVPGLLSKKIAFLLKGLPKSLRRRLTPLNATVTTIMADMPRRQEALPVALSRFVRKRFGVDVPAASWPLADLPDHLKMRIVLKSSSGQTLAASRDTAVLTRPLTGDDSTVLQTLRAKWERPVVSGWDFADLPAQLTGKEAKDAGWAVYPALVKEGDTIALRLLPQRKTAMAAHRQAVAALAARHFSRELKFLKKALALTSSQKKMSAPFGGGPAVLEMIVERLAGTLFAADIRQQSDWLQHLDRVRPKIHPTGTVIRDAVLPVMAAYQDTLVVLADMHRRHRTNPPMRQFIEGLQQQLERLVPAHFIRLYDSQRCTHLTRYVAALGLRAQRAAVDLEKDRRKSQSLAPFEENLTRLLDGLTPADTQARRDAVEAFFWMLEELKVSVFAQELGTAQPVSPKRLRSQLKKIEALV